MPYAVEACVFAGPGVQVAGVPEDEGVQDQTKDAELVLLAFPAGLSYLAPAAVEDESGKGVPGFLQSATTRRSERANVGMADAVKRPSIAAVTGVLAAVPP